MDNTDLRRKIRRQRRAISEEAQKNLAQKLSEQLRSAELIQQATKVGLYLSHDGEIDPSEFMHWAWGESKMCYLPVLNEQPDQAMTFAPITQHSQFAPNRFHIPEPIVAAEEHLSARDLELILLPLVAFDPSGNRLGMGGGYYDRTLAFTRQQPYHQRPLLIGLAHEFQRVSHIEPAPWDIPLAGIATEQHIILFEHHSA